jgi:hypothetical protein
LKARLLDSATKHKNVDVVPRRLDEAGIIKSERGLCTEVQPSFIICKR